ncbi:MAG TPA: class I SAM-dependent methyltransferase [Candidatus Saccharimonadales bacterium]|nr:class I SAM-dependent methyltransferase [Candidatus Saccharimonadales bacterium]
MSYYADSEYVEDSNTPWYKALKLMPDSLKLLDVGCSSGNFDEVVIDRKRAIVDGIELNKKDAAIAAKKLRKVFNFNIETDDLSALDTDYDVIYLGDIIEHLVDPSAALKRLKELLNKKGTVVFSIPNMAHISVRLMLLAGKFEYGNTGLLDRTHLHYYDKAEIERVFHTAGYKIEKLDWVSRDIPKELLDTELKRIGLKANETFYALAKDLDAGAYQYIGKAVPVSGPIAEKPRPSVSPAIDTFEKHLADMRKSYEDDVHRLEQRNSEQINVLTAKINDYEKSTSWKVTKPLRKVSKIVRKVGS